MCRLSRREKSVNEDLSLLIKISSPETAYCTFNIYIVCKTWFIHSLHENADIWYFTDQCLFVLRIVLWNLHRLFCNWTLFFLLHLFLQQHQKNPMKWILQRALEEALFFNKIFTQSTKLLWEITYFFLWTPLIVSSRAGEGSGGGTQCTSPCVRKQLITHHASMLPTIHS